MQPSAKDSYSRPVGSAQSLAGIDFESLQLPIQVLIAVIAAQSNQIRHFNNRVAAVGVKTRKFVVVRLDAVRL